MRRYFNSLMVAIYVVGMVGYVGMWCYAATRASNMCGGVNADPTSRTEQATFRR